MSNGIKVFKMNDKDIYRISESMENVGFNIGDIKLVVEALEKQIPKKPSKTRHLYIIEDSGETIEKFFAHCPYCFEVKGLGYWDSLIDKGTAYCRRCGQAIDWE